MKPALTISLLLTLYLTFSTAHPAVKEKSTATLTLNAKLEATKVIDADQDSRVPLRTESHPTVSCVHIHPFTGGPSSRNHDACSRHCRSLTDKYVGGECSDRGICHCKYPVRRGHDEWGVDDPHPTVRCVDLIPADGEESAINDRLCLVHCTTLHNGYRHGECSDGICYCSHQL